MNFPKTAYPLLVVCCCLLLNLSLPAQVNDSMAIDVSAIRFSHLITRKIEYAETPKQPLTAAEIVALPFRKDSFSKFHPGIPLRLMEKTFLLRFTLVNKSSKLEEFYFTPGFYFRNLKVYKADPDNISNTIQLIPDSIIKSKVYAGSRLLKLDSGEKATYYVSMNFIRTNANNFAPYIIEKDYLRAWMMNVKFRDPAKNIITYLISGILLLMIFYSLAVYLQNLSKEFLFYSVYALCSTVLFFLKSYSVSQSTEWNFIYEEYFDFMILCLGVFFYLIFVRSFINTREEHQLLDKFLRISQWILIGLLVVFSVIYFFTDQFTSLYILENYIIKVFMFGIGVVFVWYSFTRRDKLLNYLALGNFVLLAFSVVSLLMLLGFKIDKNDPSNLVNNGLIYYEVGVTLELMFFLAGLAYKNRRDLTERVQERERFKLENERKEFEKQIAIVTTRQEERDRISADMHDELGSGMTAIRLMSEIVRTKMKDQAFPELEKISNSANDLLGKMNSIIWTMKSSNDTLESLVAYLRAHSLEYFESTPVTCKVQVPDHIPPTVMSGEKRRNIFLSVKESLNNILKHAQATEVTINMSLQDKTFVIKVSDNGVGIDTEKLRRFGNGLSNMKRRMESINGDFNVENSNGSVITFTSPL
jgi:signal transduction histidine kinase